ncbi:MAG: hypothetical protein KDK05_00545 [Candidatus Competibacteraceae bacterium]|nr:hypothetical protein [Anaerolineales bacterium]MCB1713606.1 hypothetical protein [Candidatus Competibacteraceae bacterium]
MKKIILLVAFFFMLAGCTSEPETITVAETKEIPVTVEVEVTREVVSEVEVTRLVETEVEVTRIVTETVLLEVTQTPPPQPAQFFTLEGAGDVVSDNYDWQPCQKAVFSWEAMGQDNIIIRLWKTTADNNVLLVNEISPASGEVLQPLSGGTYWITVTGPAEGWGITAECQD